ncbi:unnamed protein product [Closterium sp. NIES-64]|nr:unnamed protein product [Closterium sp. NIES-64]
MLLAVTLGVRVLGVLRPRVRVLAVLRLGVLTMGVLRVLVTVELWVTLLEIVRRSRPGGGAGVGGTPGRAAGAGATSLGGLAGAGGAGAASPGGTAGGTGDARASSPGGAASVGGATGAGGARGTTGGTGAASAGGAAGARRAGAAIAGGAAGAGDTRGTTGGAAYAGGAGAASAGGAGARSAGAGGTRAAGAADDLARAASPTDIRLLATVITNPAFKSTAAFALVTELVDFAARSRLDYVASLVTESESVCPPSIGGEPTLGSDVLKDRQFELECLAAVLPRFAYVLLCPEGDPNALDIPTPRTYAEAIVGEYSSQWQTAMDAEMGSWKSTGTYLNEVPPTGADIVDGMWIFRVKRPSGSLPVFKARNVARGFRQPQGVDYFQTFLPTLKMTTLQMLLHVTAQRDYELHSLDFSTAFL